VLPTPFIFPDTKDEFVRDPYCANFAITGASPALQIAICTQHAVFGDAMGPREAEATALTGVVAEAKRRFPSAEVVVCGDHNLPPTNKGWNAMKALGFVPNIVDPLRTTVGSVSLYDNCWLPPAIAQRTYNAFPGGCAVVSC
jgi:hypothetical protein